VIRWNRFASLAAGVLFVVLLLIGFLITSNTPDVTDTAQKVQSYYVAHRGRTGAGAYLIGLSIFFGLFWFGSFRGFLRRSPAAERLAAVFLAGGVLFAVSGALVAGTLFALTDSPRHLDPSAAQALNVLQNDLEAAAFQAGMAVMWVAAGLAIERSRLLPRWLGWTAIVIGIVALTPVGWLTVFALMVWTLVVSVLVYMRSTDGSEPGAAS
jgi:hypothetical protein